MVEDEDDDRGIDVAEARVPSSHVHAGIRKARSDFVRQGCRARDIIRKTCHNRVQGIKVPHAGQCREHSSIRRHDATTQLRKEHIQVKVADLGHRQEKLLGVGADEVVIARK